MELVKDYDCSILYHLCKANIMADALSRKSMESLAYIQVGRRLIVQELQQDEKDGIQLQIAELGIFLTHVEVKFPLVNQIVIT